MAVRGGRTLHGPIARSGPPGASVQRCATDMLLQRLFALLVLAVVAATATPTARADEADYDRGVEAYRARDYASARLYWSRAVADNADPSAENNLGYLFYYGLGGDVDRPRGIGLWLHAAGAGHDEAQWHLGVAYAEGKGIARNLVEAYAWLRCAVVNAEAQQDGEVADHASRSLAGLLPHLPSADFVAAESRARLYIRRFAGAAPGPEPPDVPVPKGNKERLDC